MLSGIRKDKIPSEILDIPGLRGISKNAHRLGPAIYFLCLEGKIVYVGKSDKLWIRIYSHIYDDTKKFDTIFYVHVYKHELLEVEQYYIKLYKPMYNKELYARGKNKDTIPKPHRILMMEREMKPYIPYNPDDNNNVNP